MQLKGQPSGARMQVNLGNNNKINKSTIGNNNVSHGTNNDSLIKDIVVGIFVTVIGGIILAFVMSLF